jgi:thioredoxin-related protein
MTDFTRNALCLLLLIAAPMARSDAAVAWREWEPGLEEARKEDRPVLVDVYTEWCGWCKRMDRDVYSRPEVRAYLDRNFVTVKLDAAASKPGRYEGRLFTSRSLAARFGVTGYPTTVFLRPGGEYITRVPGYVPAERFLQVLRYIGEGHLDRGVSFEEFLEQPSKSR